MVVLLLARESKRPFKEVAKSLLDYIKHYDEKEQDAAA